MLVANLTSDAYLNFIYFSFDKFRQEFFQVGKMFCKVPMCFSPLIPLHKFRVNYGFHDFRKIIESFARANRGHAFQESQWHSSLSPSPPFFLPAVCLAVVIPGPKHFDLTTSCISESNQAYVAISFLCCYSQQQIMVFPLHFFSFKVLNVIITN